MTSIRQRLHSALAGNPIAGLDSLTPPPEGDLTFAEARALWPDTFFWTHSGLTWDALSDADLAARIRDAVRAAGNRFCLQLSEEVSPNWKRTIPLILRTLREEIPA